MVFVADHWLWLLALWPLAVVWAVRLTRRETSYGIALGARVVRGRGWAGVVAVLLVILGLGDPRQPDDAREALAGLDVMVLWDHSASMLAGDGGGRFEQARQELLALVAETDARVGLVAFAGDARMVCPLTRDRAVLAELIRRQRPQLMDVGGSDVSAGLRLALERLPGDRPSLVVLLSDGELGAGGPSAVVAGEALVGDELSALLSAARARPVPIFTRCTDKGSGAQVFEEANGERRPLLDEAGRPVLSQVRPERLQELAESTGGKVLRALSARTLQVESVQSGLLPRDTLQPVRGVWIAAWCLMLAELWLRGALRRGSHR